MNYLTFLLGFSPIKLDFCKVQIQKYIFGKYIENTFFFLFLRFIYLFEREHAQWVRAEVEGERESQADTVLSSEPNMA